MLYKLHYNYITTTLCQWTELKTIVLIPDETAPSSDQNM